MAARRVVVFSGSLLALVIISGALALVFTYNALLLPVSSEEPAQSVIVEIPEGAGTEQIASILKESGVIRNTLVFRFYTRWRNLDREFIAGKYKLSPAMSLEEVAEAIAVGDIYRETNWFTIPEGFSVEQMAARLGEQGLTDEKLFLELVQRPPESITAQFDFLQQIEPGRVYFLLEGYLFPDTYEIYVGASAEEIIFLMLRRLEQIFNHEYQQRAREIGMSMHQVLTLASIIEREGRVDHERPLISGVFHNRLKTNHPLQSCATIQYILGEVKERLLYADLMIPSPFNTYQNPGLPPGPIASPGAASIRAALYPTATEMFFFVYKEDGSGEHYFSRTLSEHNAYKEKAQRNRLARGSGS